MTSLVNSANIEGENEEMILVIRHKFQKIGGLLTSSFPEGNRTLI